MSAQPHTALRVLITGAGRGLGHALARALYPRADQLVLSARRAEDVARLQAEFPGALVLELDLARPEHMAEALAPLDGLAPLTGVVHNAGVFHEPAALADTSHAQLREALTVNLLGPLELTRQLLPHCARGATFLWVSSSAAGQPGRGAYGLSKAAVNTAAHMLANELTGQGMHSYAIDPGALRTDMRAQARPEEDPAEVPLPETVIPAFLELLGDAHPPVSLIHARQWPGCVTPVLGN